MRAELKLRVQSVWEDILQHQLLLAAALKTYKQTAVDLMRVGCIMKSVFCCIAKLQLIYAAEYTAVWWQQQQGTQLPGANIKYTT